MFSARDPILFGCCTFGCFFCVLLLVAETPRIKPVLETSAVDESCARHCFSFDFVQNTLRQLDVIVALYVIFASVDASERHQTDGENTAFRILLSGHSYHRA